MQPQWNGLYSEGWRWTEDAYWQKQESNQLNQDLMYWLEVDAAFI